MSAAAFQIHIAGDGPTFACLPGDTLLRAGLRAGLGLPYECNAGACGSCKLDLLTGEVEDLYPDAPGIRPRDRERGRRLACQTRPHGDCSIKTRLDDACVPLHRPLRQTATLEATREVTHDIRQFRLRTEAPAAFRAGQYAMLQLAGLPVQRAYSMSNVPNGEGVWEFMVRRTDGGQFSNALFQLQAGAGVEIDGPYGMAYLREDPARDIVCIAGGSGLAPVLSILDAAAQHAATRRLGAWLFYGGRSPRDVPVIADCLQHHGMAQGLKWRPVVSVPALAQAAGWSGETGFVHELLPRQLPKPLADYRYYFAGPPPMIEATVRLLVAEHKVPPAQLHFDRFF